MVKRITRAPFRMGQQDVPAGTSLRVELPVTTLPTLGQVSLPVSVVHGKSDGPVLWLSAAVHGDELNGVDIIRQVLQKLDPLKLSGTVLAVPVVNVFGFLNESRYLPDRRDLNRSFPGNSKGSLAGRLADLFMREVVSKCTHGIDLHTAASHRINLPQIRADLSQPGNLECGKAFGAPLILDSPLRDGSLRRSAGKKGIPVLVYEAGEPQRFNRDAVEVGVDGILRVMAFLGMRTSKPRRRGRAQASNRVADSSSWVRARKGGLFRCNVELGQEVEAKQPLGIVADAFGEKGVNILAPRAGIIIGQALNPLVYQGDALIHLAALK